MSDEELAKAYLSHAFDKAVEKVGAATVAKSLVSDAQKPVDWQKPVFTYLIDNIRRTTHFDADLISEILEYAKRHKVAQPKLTPPDGGQRLLGWQRSWRN